MEYETNENKYRYYVYDYIIGQYLLVIDTKERKLRIDSFNIYGQCYTLNKEWKKITSALINRAYKFEGYAIDNYIREHFSEDNEVKNNVSNNEDLLFKSNSYDDCILFIVKYGKENRNCTFIEKFDYYKKYLTDKSKNIDTFNQKQEDYEMGG